MSERPRPGECYRHFKNKLYQIITVARHSETREEMVVYQALYGDFSTYVRPLSMFISPVDREKYPDVKQTYRFERVCLRQTAGQAQEVQAEDGGCQNLEPDSQANPYLLRFLETEDVKQRILLLEQMEGKIGQKELDSLYLVLDVKAGSGTVAEQLTQLVSYLKMCMQYDGSRLR